jgi:hypothetical protein
MSRAPHRRRADPTAERRCAWRGCTAKATVHLKGRPEGEHLCARHTRQVIKGAKFPTGMIRHYRRG